MNKEIKKIRTIRELDEYCRNRLDCPECPLDDICFGNFDNLLEEIIRIDRTEKLEKLLT